ncbi:MULTISPECIES: hypothetical protein [unclassified Paraburkholderia]|uniref:hypothetical protein n=1 Tax=unclassified Paraburkholderia TaxID=2615204 RepID=UPI002AB5EF04|nr:MULTISPECIES: hypothetical protein [unclassified Paraburkholderia]
MKKGQVSATDFTARRLQRPDKQFTDCYCCAIERKAPGLTGGSGMRRMFKALTALTPAQYRQIIGRN